MADPMTAPRPERLTDEDLDGIARFGAAIESDQQAMAVELLELQQRREQVEAELALALGVISAQDERETQAGARCDVPREQYGCDWPDAMADALLEARSEMRLARAERDHERLRYDGMRSDRDDWRMRCEASQTRLAQLQARYDDLLSWCHAAQMAIQQDDRASVYEAVESACRVHPIDAALRRAGEGA